MWDAKVRILLERWFESVLRPWPTVSHVVVHLNNFLKSQIGPAFLISQLIWFRWTWARWMFIWLRSQKCLACTNCSFARSYQSFSIWWRGVYMSVIPLFEYLRLKIIVLNSEQKWIGEILEWSIFCGSLQAWKWCWKIFQRRWAVETCWIQCENV